MFYFFCYCAFNFLFDHVVICKSVFKCIRSFSLNFGYSSRFIMFSKWIVAVALKVISCLMNT